MTEITIGSDADKILLAEANMLRQGVNTTFLAKAIGRPKPAVDKMLKDCPVKSIVHNSSRYELAKAFTFLVPQDAGVVEDTIKNMRPDDLPVRLVDSYWAGKLKRLKFETEAKDLWRTEDVMEQFSDVFLTIKETTTLWAESIDREHGITDEQRTTLLRLTDGLLQDISIALVDMPKKGLSQKQVDLLEEKEIEAEEALIRANELDEEENYEDF